MSTIKYDGILGLPKLATQFFAAFAFCGLVFAWAIGYPIGRFVGGSNETGKSLAQYNMIAALYAPLCVIIPIYGNYLHYRCLQKSDALDKALRLGGCIRPKKVAPSRPQGTADGTGQAPQSREPLRYRISATVWGWLGALAGFSFWIQFIEKFRTRPSGFVAAFAPIYLLIGLSGAGVSVWCFMVGR